MFYMYMFFVLSIFTMTVCFCCLCAVFPSSCKLEASLIYSVLHFLIFFLLSLGREEKGFQQRRSLTGDEGNEVVL